MTTVKEFVRDISKNPVGGYYYRDEDGLCCPLGLLMSEETLSLLADKQLNVDRFETLPDEVVEEVLNALEWEEFTTEEKKKEFLNAVQEVADGRTNVFDNFEEVYRKFFSDVEEG